MTRMLSTKTVLAVQMFWLCSFVACSNDLPATPDGANAGHAAPPSLMAGSPAATAPSTPAASSPSATATTSTPATSSPSATAPASTTSPAKPAAGGGGAAAPAAGGGGRAAAAAGATTASAGSGSSASGGAGGAGGDSSDDDPFGLGGDPTAPSTDPNSPPAAGMCENLGCFDIFDCAIFHPDEAAVCNFTDCVDFVCKQ